VVERLYRSRRERVFGGVAGGMATALGVDVGWIRVAWVLFAFFTGGAAVLVYIVLLFVIPEEPVADAGPGPGPAETFASGDTASTASGGSAPTRRPVEAPGNLPLVLGVILILIGAWYLVRQLLPAIDVGALWPIGAIALGVLLLVVSLRRPR
jgi:phage shock protein C